MRFLDLHFNCPRCRHELIANEPSSGRVVNTYVRAALSRHVGPYDTHAFYHGTVTCPGCSARLSVAFRDAIRRYSPRTEITSVRTMDPEEVLVE